MSKRLKILIGVFAILIVIVVSIVLLVNQMNDGLAELDDEQLPTIDLTTIEDGTYLGSYEIPLISVEVEVTVVDHEITNIVILEHKNGRGDDGEIIIDDVILEQSINVDFISGATYSSKAILLAIGNALK
jgi:uncharacterized protein with FMN-binding domain